MVRKNKNGNAVWVKYNPDRGMLVSTYWDTRGEFSGVVKELKTYVRHENNATITQMYSDDVLISTNTTYDGHP